MPRDADPAALNARFEGDPGGALAHALSGALGPVALVSSFGAESAVLLHMAAQLDPAVPVIFLDTLRLFPETLEHHAALVARLGLTDVRRVTPAAEALHAADPAGRLHRADPDSCCALRKTLPLERALAPFAGWISGRKRFQGGQRAGIAMFEREAPSGRIKVNPLAGQGPAELAAYFERHGLPRHPLVARGYASIGCAPCTGPVAPGEDPRAGRWRGSDKTECGIHVAAGRVLPGRAA